MAFLEYTQYRYARQPFPSVFYFFSKQEHGPLVNMLSCLLFSVSIPFPLPVARVLDKPFRVLVS